MTSSGAGDPSQGAEVDAREHDEEHEADERVDRLALQVVGGVAGGDRRPGGARAVDHDEPEGDEPERDEHEQAVLERALRLARVGAPGAALRRDRLAAPSREASTSARKRVAALLEVVELVEARTRRREEHDLAGRGVGERARRPPSRGRRSATYGTPSALERRPRARRPSRRSGRRGRRRARAPCARARRTACPSGCRRGSRAARAGTPRAPRSADSGFVAFESFTKRTPRTSPTGSRRCGTPGKRRKRLGDRVVGNADRPRRRGRGGGVLAVVRAGDQRLGGQRVVCRELDPPRTARDRAEPARDDGHVVRRPGSRRSAAWPPGRRSRLPWRSRWSGVRLRSTATRHVERVDVLELEARELADDRLVRSSAPSSAAERAADVPGHRDRPAGRTEDGTEELGRRRLPVRARSPRPSGCADEPRAELDLAPDGDAALPRAATTSGASLGTPGLFTRSSTPSTSARSCVRAEPHFDTGRAKPPGVERGRAVDARRP